MAQNSWQIGLIGSLNESESVTKINSDINKINKQLGTLKLNTEINQSSISELEKQLKTLNIQLSNVTINKDVINNLVNQINEGLKNINIANININNVSNQAQQLGQQIGQEVSSGVNSIIQKNEFEKVFNFSQSDRNNIATKARDYFKQLSNGIVTVKEEMKELDGNTSLNAFTINIKNAKGEVESLRYALKNIIDDNGNVTGQQFQYTGGSINDVNAVKQFEQLNKVITDYQIKLNDLKTKYSNANVDYSEFETVFDNFKQGIGTVNDLSLAFNNLKNNAEKGVQGLKSQSSSFDPIQQALNNMRDFPSMLQSLQANMDGLKDKSALAGISFNDLAQTYEKLKGNIDQSGGKVPLTEKWTSDYQNLMSTIVAVTKQVEALKKAEMSDNSSAKISENALFIQEKIDIGSYDLQISNLETKFKKLGLSEDEVAEKTKNVKNALASMKESGIGQQELINREELFNTELTTTSNQLKIMTNEMSMFMSSTQQVNLTTRIQKWLDTNTAATRKARQELQSYLTELNSGQVTKIRGNEIKANFAQVDAQMRSIGKLGNSFFKTIGDGMKKFSYWTSSTYIVMKTIHSIKQSVSTVSELDTALVDLKKTTSMTSSQLNEFYYTANDIAKQMGVTTQEIINQTSAWSRLGLIK